MPQCISSPIGPEDEAKANLLALQEEELRVKRMLAELYNKKTELYTNNAIAFFTPSQKQDMFVRYAEAKFRAIFAGNRFGKSTLGAVEAVSWLLGERRFYDVDDPRRTLGIPDRGVKILCIAEDWEKVKELFTNEGDKLDKPGKIWEFMPKDVQVRKEKNQNGIIVAIYVTVEKGGMLRKSAIFFDTVKSYKNNPRAAESNDWDFIWLDEPIPQDMWKAVSRGLIDRNGSMMALLTPLCEPWLYHFFAENAKERELSENLSGGMWWTHASMEDNPTLSPEAIETYLQQLDPIERECRRRGIPLALGNLVISTYDESKHLWNTSDRGLPPGWLSAYEPPADYLVCYAIDTHPQTPTAVLFVAIAPNGDVYFYNELWIGGMDKDRMTYVADEIRRCVGSSRLGYELCEPAAWNGDPETGRCFADVFLEHGLYIEKASKARTFAVRETRMLFASSRNVYVLDHMRCLRNELKRWSFTKDNSPEDKNDHFCECLGRLIVHDNLRYYPAPAATPASRNVADFEHFDYDALMSDLNYVQPW